MAGTLLQRLLVPLLAVLVAAKSRKQYPDAGLDVSEFHCSLDPKVNEENFASYAEDIEGIWGYSCGRNRGIFVLEPPDGQTYCKSIYHRWKDRFLFGIGVEVVDSFF